MCIRDRGNAAANSSNGLLKYGVRSDAVRTLQQNLKTLGYYDGSVTGNFGRLTKEAVYNFQKANGLSADGVAGAKTLLSLIHISMAQYTTLRIGGPAEVMVNIHSADEIAVALRAAKQADAPVTIIGNGSNLLVRDGGIRGLVLRISGGLNAIRREGDCLLVQAGASLAAVAAFARDEGLSGMAELGGIPGTVGGGVLMNAGAYGAELAQLVTQAEGCLLYTSRCV